MCRHHLDDMVHPLTHQVIINIHHPSLFIHVSLLLVDTLGHGPSSCVKRDKGEEGSHSPGWMVTGTCILTIWMTWHIVNMPGHCCHLLSIQLVTWHCLVVIVVGICSVGSRCQTTVVEGGCCWSWCNQSVVHLLLVATSLMWPLLVVWRKERVQGRDQVAHLN